MYLDSLKMKKERMSVNLISIDQCTETPNSIILMHRLCLPLQSDTDNFLFFSTLKNDTVINIKLFYVLYSQSTRFRCFPADHNWLGLQKQILKIFFPVDSINNYETTVSFPTRCIILKEFHFYTPTSIRKISLEYLLKMLLSDTTIKSFLAASYALHILLTFPFGPTCLTPEKTTQK